MLELSNDEMHLWTKTSYSVHGFLHFVTHLGKYMGMVQTRCGFHSNTVLLQE